MVPFENSTIICRGLTHAKKYTLTNMLSMKNQNPWGWKISIPVLWSTILSSEIRSYKHYGLVKCHIYYKNAHSVPQINLCIQDDFTFTSGRSTKTDAGQSVPCPVFPARSSNFTIVSRGGSHWTSNRKAWRRSAAAYCLSAHRTSSSSRRVNGKEGTD